MQSGDISLPVEADETCRSSQTIRPSQSQPSTLSSGITGRWSCSSRHGIANAEAAARQGEGRWEMSLKRADQEGRDRGGNIGRSRREAGRRGGRVEAGRRAVETGRKVSQIVMMMADGRDRSLAASQSVETKQGS